MKSILSLFWALGLLAGCASKPASQSHIEARSNASRNEEAERALLRLFSSAMLSRHPESVSAQYFETKIPFVALDLVHSLVVARRATGEWPSQESIALPAGVKSISLDPSEDFLEVCIVGDEALLLRCRIGGDGEVIIPPKFVQDPVEWDVPIATQTEEQGSR